MYFISIREFGKPNRVFLTNQYSRQELKEKFRKFDSGDKYFNLISAGKKLDKDFIIKLKADAIIETECETFVAYKKDKIIIHPDVTYELKSYYSVRDFLRDVKKELEDFVDRILEAEV